jgi:hypothetical protein
MHTADKLELTRNHHLFLPERRFAAFVLERQRTHRAPVVLRFEQNYGHVGIALAATAILLEISGAVVIFSGIILMFVSGNHGQLLTTGYVVLFVGIAVEIPAMIRAIQGIHAARRFRGDRPFVK